MKRRMIFAALLCALLALGLSGCLFKPVNALYTLPQQPPEYDALQSELDRLLATGMQYSAPASGDNLQAVQMADLTGDGVDEVLVFLKASGEKPLQVYIYEKQGGQYENIAVLTSSGSSFDRVDYVQLDGAPGLEIILGTQVSAQVLQSLHAYTLQSGGAAELLSTNYFRYTTADLDADGVEELVSFRSGEADQPGVAERFVCDGGQLVPAGQANLSQPLEADGIARLLCGYVQEGLCGVFAASRLPEGGLVTDVFALWDDVFTNIALQEGSAGTAREGEIFGMDIDDDGFVELPSVQYLQKLENQDTRTYYLVDWYNLDADGGKHTKLATYYNVESGWYLKLPPAWRGKVLVHYGEDESGHAGYGFYLYAAAPEQTQWAATIYQFTGPDAQTRANEDGRFLLAAQGDVAFAAALSDDAGLTEAELGRLFCLVHMHWNAA